MVESQRTDEKPVGIIARSIRISWGRLKIFCLAIAAFALVIAIPMLVWGYDWAKANIDMVAGVATVIALLVTFAGIRRNTERSAT